MASKGRRKIKRVKLLLLFLSLLLFNFTDELFYHQRWNSLDRNEQKGWSNLSSVTRTQCWKSVCSVSGIKTEIELCFYHFWQLLISLFRKYLRRLCNPIIPKLSNGTGILERYGWYGQNKCCEAAGTIEKLFRRITLLRSNR